LYRLKKDANLCANMAGLPNLRLRITVPFFNLHAKSPIFGQKALYTYFFRCYTLPANMIKANKIRQLLALFVVLTSFSITAAIIVKLYRGREKAESLRKLPRNIDISLQKIHFTETRNGMKKWDLVADKAEYDKKGEVTHLTGVHLVVAGDHSTGDITLTSPLADFYNISKDVKLVGKVEAKSASGMEFTSENATYLAARSMIVTNGWVKFTDGTLSLDGVGMEFVPASKNVRIFSKVTANIMPKAVK
jgi:LPS export ABC transporter protein LptC